MLNAGPVQLAHPALNNMSIRFETFANRAYAKQRDDHHLASRLFIVGAMMAEGYDDN